MINAQTAQTPFVTYPRHACLLTMQAPGIKEPGTKGRVPTVELRVCCPDIETAKLFAEEHGFRDSGEAAAQKAGVAYVALRTETADDGFSAKSYGCKVELLPYVMLRPAPEAAPVETVQTAEQA